MHEAVFALVVAATTVTSYAGAEDGAGLERPVTGDAHGRRLGAGGDEGCDAGSAACSSTSL